MEKPVKHKWSIDDIFALVDRVNELHYYVDAAEEGLADRKRCKAAHAECRCFAKSLFVLRALSRLAFFVSQYGRKGLPHCWYHAFDSVFRADDLFPSYLDTFEEYVSFFGDAWFDTDENRNLFFELIRNAFVEIIRQVGYWAGHDTEHDRRLNFAVGFFLQEFDSAATLESHKSRQSMKDDLLEGFRAARKLIEPLIAAAEKVEKGLRKQYPLLEPIELKGAATLKWLSETGRQKGETLLRRSDDERPACKADDKRYDRIECIAAILSAMPPSVTRFMECCRLIEESAIVASQLPRDSQYSSRNFVTGLFAELLEHPKRAAAKSIADLSFSDDEKGQMSVAVKNMSLALLRLRQKLKANTGFGWIDPEEFDEFIALIPSQLGPETRNYRALLFEEGDAATNDGYNARPFGILEDSAQTQMGRILFRTTKRLEAEKDSVLRLLAKAYDSGSRDVIDRTYDALVKKYFTGERKTKAEPSGETADIGLDGLIEAADDAAIAPSPIGKDYKYSYRFAYAPKYVTLIDVDHQKAPYCIAPYEKFTAVSVVEIIKTLLRAVGKKDGWVKCDPSWRLRFKDQPYKRFKDEQIEVGTKGNQHLGEWRIIPRDLFQELTKAPRAAKPGVGSVGTVSMCGKSSHG